MKTQGITLMSAQTTEVKIKKKTNASDSTFDNFIANSASGVGRQNANPQTSIADAKSSMESKSTKVQKSEKSEDGSSSSITQSKDASKEQVNTTQDTGNDRQVKNDTPKTDGSTQSTEVSETAASPVAEDGSIDIEKVNEEIMAILQDILNLLPQDVQDIFDNIGMQPADLITGLKTGEIESFSITTVQVFVMEVHGIEDPSAFLTNDALNQEMNDIFDRMKTLVSELMRIGVEDLEKAVDDGTWETFAKDLMQAVQKFTEETPELITEQTPVQPLVQEEIVMTTNVEDAPVIEKQDDSNPDMTVVIENRTSDQAGSGTGQQTGQGTGLGADDLRDAAADLDAMSRQAQTTNAQAFAESLTQALEPEATQVQDMQRQMTEMVEQVVRQVRVRMMPESTNMEIQLHPASLGRVNVQINAAGQETTARLIVENQAAKEALESGMIRLQEAFEERGIKVQAVEVTVGSFDLGLQQDNNNFDQNSGEGNGRGNRNGSGNSAEGSDSVVSDNQTEASRRDVNSTVDYTA